MGLGNRITRAAALGGVTARTAAGWALGAVARGLGRSGPAVTLERAAAARAAERLGELKGLAMKIGQILSFVSPDVPPELRDALAALQTHSRPRPFREIANSLEEALGLPLKEAFRSVDPLPIAAASIGQVHRAVLPDGTAVAVKVQYPDVAAAVRGDLSNVSLLLQSMGLLLPGLDGELVAAEVRARFSEELDYRAEAQNQVAFAEHFEGHPFIAVPRVVPTHSTGSVLTSAFVEGRRFDAILGDAPAARARHGEILFRFLMGCAFDFGSVDGDPHPGNYLFDTAGGRVTFLDFGCVKRLPPALHDDWRRLGRALLEADLDESQSLAERLGFVAREAGGGSGGGRAAVVAALTLLYAPFELVGETPFPAPIGPGGIRGGGAELTGLWRHLRMPPDLLFFTRAMAGMWMVLARLGAIADWRRIAGEYLLGAPPATALGLAERTWREGLSEQRPGKPPGR